MLTDVWQMKGGAKPCLVYDSFETLMRPVKLTIRHLEAGIGGLCYLERLEMVKKKRGADEIDDPSPVRSTIITWYTTCFSLVNDQEYIIVWLTNYPFSSKRK